MVDYDRFYHFALGCRPADAHERKLWTLPSRNPAWARGCVKRSEGGVLLKLSPEERRSRILDHLLGGSVSIRTLVRELRISEMTARRDLVALERQGKLLRVYGGAIPNDRVAYEFSFKEKESRNRAKKEAIGRAAARLVCPGATVFLDTGTTSLSAARALRNSRPGVIITINLCVASEYVWRRAVRVIVPGGEVSHLSPDLYGELTLETLSGMTADVAFLGCDSVEPADGFYSADMKSAAVSRLMIERSRRAYLLADSSKFGRRSMRRIAPLSSLTGVVTDSALQARYRRAVRKARIDLIIGKR